MSGYLITCQASIMRPQSDFQGIRMSILWVSFPNT